jgi:outer membrane protein assembly factor BamB
MKFCALVFILLLLACALATAQVAVTTYQYDNYRSGANTNETVLTPSNVNVNQFGRKQIFAVQGFVYAQPLYVPGVVISGTSHNVVYIATEHDQVYAFDVNSGQQLWQKNLLITASSRYIVTPVSSGDVGCTDLVPEIGITGTPAIDTTIHTMFVIAKTKVHDTQTGQNSFQQTLYSLDIRTGALRNPPRGIVGTVQGTGQGSHGGYLTFDPLVEGQRAALLISGGNVYAGWASHCDGGAYHGWLMGFGEVSLNNVGMYVDTPNGREGGYWAGGSGPAVDSSGSIYIPTGNGTFDGNTDFGDSVLRLNWANRAFTLMDYFTPWDETTLDQNDNDVAAGGVLLLPDQPGAQHPHLLVQVGKEGTIDLIDRDNMGHFNPNNDNDIVQTLPFVVGGVWGAPAFWNNHAYFGGQYDHFKVFSYNPQTQQLSTGPTSQSPEAYNFPGPTPAISANGTAHGIAWVIETDHYGGGNAVLRAYDATNLGTELYNSSQNQSRDNPGAAVKFTVPTVADGHVFVGAENQVAMYGLLN